MQIIPYLCGRNMRIAQVLYRFRAYLRHQLTAWNTGGEGIHSPYLFYLVRMLFYDRHSFYCWSDIEACRRQMLLSDKVVEVEDFGTGCSGSRRVAAIAARSVKPAQQAQLLFRLVQFLSHDKGEPLHILELGTCLGLTTAYLALPDKRNKVVTFEGSGALLAIARKNWQALGIRNLEGVEGDIGDTLSIYARARKDKVDFVFMDANHTYEATLQYYEYLRPLLHAKSIVVVDDIHADAGMYRAWRQLCAREEVTSSMDLYHYGLLFFDPHYLKRNYILRV